MIEEPISETPAETSRSPNKPAANKGYVLPVGSRVSDRLEPLFKQVVVAFSDGSEPRWWMEDGVLSFHFIPSVRRCSRTLS